VKTSCGFVLLSMGKGCFLLVDIKHPLISMADMSFRQKIDVLANVAGVMDAYEAADVYTDKEWDHIMAVNLTAPTRLIRAVLPFMKSKKKGSIINVASKAGLSGAAAGIAYTASKHGLVRSSEPPGLLGVDTDQSIQLGVTKSTAWRFREEGIRCNAVLPGSKFYSELQIIACAEIPAIDTNFINSIAEENIDQESFSHLA
jgi:NAD(P)-dependent dehydrogenase (short-subunit alcohol dehydrogenase family)